MATLSLSRLCVLALPLAAMCLVTPALARHHHHRLHKSHPSSNNRNTAPALETPATPPVPEPRPTGAEGGVNTEAAPPKQDKERQPSAGVQSTVPQTPAVVATPPEKPAELEPEPPATAPLPPQKPDEAGGEKMLPDPRSAELPADKMPEEEIACRGRLKALGVEFEEHKAEHDAGIGCSIPYPIVLKTLGKSIGITPGAEIDCQMAEAVARFAVNVIQPTAKAEFDADLKSISQASAFVCRPRHGTHKLSEHAFGNALDIASFTLSDGSKIEVGPTPPEKDAKFLDAVRKAACGPFKTVLGPGSDADHSLHFHFDLEPRRHGGTFCQ